MSSPAAPPTRPRSSPKLNRMLFDITCDVIDCQQEAKYEKEITVRDMMDRPFTFIVYFCEKHRNDDGVSTPWGHILVKNKNSKKNDALQNGDLSTDFDDTLTYKN